MSKEVSKVNVKELASGIVHHEVTWMSISNSKYISSNALTSQRLNESVVVSLKSLLDFLLLRCSGEFG
jgi:hypothetical protein